MHIRLAALAAGLALTACTPVVVYRQPGPPAPDDRPSPVSDPITPLEITLGRPIGDRLYVQTNRPAYVAIFEVVPDYGVTMVRPANVRQRTYMVSGLSRLSGVWYQRGTTRDGRQVMMAKQAARYIYAVASDEPLWMPDEAFHSAGMRSLIGTSAWHARNPGATMRAISRRFVPAVSDEMWAEDAIYIPATYDERALPRVRVYCRNGPMFEVPADMADRVWCPTLAGGTARRPVPPDSVVGDNGRRVRRRPADPPGRRRFDRIDELPAPPDSRGRGVGAPDDREDNGRKLGHTDETKPGGGRGDEVRRPEEDRGNGRASSDSIRRRAMDDAFRRKPASQPDSQPAPKPAPPGNKPAAKPETKPETKPEAKPETKPEAKPETKPEAKPETRPEAKPTAKQESKPESKPDKKADSKPESKTEDSKAKGKATEPSER